MPPKMFNGPADPTIAAKAQEQLANASVEEQEPEEPSLFDTMKNTVSKGINQVGAATDWAKNKGLNTGVRTLAHANDAAAPDWAKKIHKKFVGATPEEVANAANFNDKVNDAKLALEMGKITSEQYEEIVKQEGQNAGLDNNYSEAEGAAPTPAPTPEQEYKAQSILEAWKDGKIDKSTRDYLIANTLSTAAGNIGRLFNNIGAAYSGGTIDNNQDQSLWSQEQAKLLNPDAMDSRKMNRARIAAQNINNMNAGDRRSVAAKIKKQLDKVDPTSMEGERLYNLYNKIMGGGQMSMLDMLGSGIMELFE